MNDILISSQNTENRYGHQPESEKSEGENNEMEFPEGAAALFYQMKSRVELEVVEVEDIDAKEYQSQKGEIDVSVEGRVETKAELKSRS